MRTELDSPQPLRSRIRRLLLRILAAESGSVMMIVAGGMVIFLGIAGLVLDAGRAFIVRAELSRAVDAGVLAGARALRTGESVARRQAFAVALANGISSDDPNTTLSVSFGKSPEGDNTVTMTAAHPMSTSLMRLLGRRSVDVGVSATAVVPPLDLVFVIDQSSSLHDYGAWDDLQDAARLFIDYFSDDIDQMSVVSFNTRAATRLPLQAPFRTEAKNRVNEMQSVGWTNTAEGLRLAYQQITGGAVRERAVKVVVFFTDGRPTAFRGTIGGQERILAVAAYSPNVVRGYWDDPDAIPMDRWLRPAEDACKDVVYCEEWVEAGHPPHGVVGRKIARDMGLVAADQIRSRGAYVYTIALGNPLASSPLAQPDLDYLADLANENGRVNSRQPAGLSYYAPSAEELRAVFRQVAADLVIRLSR